MITLQIVKGKAYVWNSEDWYILRSRHRICGPLIGSIASFPRQNDFQGLPMALMSEETALLVEKGICKLVELPNLNNDVSTEQLQAVHEIEQRQVKEQHEVLRKKKIEQLSQKIDIIVAGKKKKMIAKGTTNIDINKEAMLQEEINKLPEVAPAHILVHIPTEHYIDTEMKEIHTDILEPSVLDRKGSLRCLIFKDLWEQGLYITSGSKFGSDFLVYPGDPVKFHSAYMLRCVLEEETFHPSNLVAYGRLSVSVNKMAVLGFCNAFGQIYYQTLQWHDSLYV